MHRRDFLDPRHFAAALDPPPAEALALLRCSRRAMATQFEIALPCGTPAALAAAEDALDEIDRLESQLTVYREQSELSRLNRLAATAPVPVEPRLFDLLTLCARLTEVTDGAFDVSVGALVKAWGFYKRRGRVPKPAERTAVLERCGMRHVELDPERRGVRFLRPGLEINLGSIGKGYALDRAAELLRSRWRIGSALLHGGGSSVLALGAPPNDPRGWAVTVKHPWEPERNLGLLRMRDRALGTSAATFQHLEHEGRKLGHILDPRTGWPAEALASATAVAPTAALADALATAFFILGVEPARELCAANPGLGAVLLPPGEDARPVVIGLTRAEVELARVD